MVSDMSIESISDALAQIIRETAQQVPNDSVSMYQSYLTARIARYFTAIDDDFDNATFREACYRLCGEREESE
jgi:hypothetical protein